MDHVDEISNCLSGNIRKRSLITSFFNTSPKSNELDVLPSTITPAPSLDIAERKLKDKQRMEYNKILSVNKYKIQKRNFQSQVRKQNLNLVLNQETKKTRITWSNEKI